MAHPLSKFLPLSKRQHTINQLTGKSGYAGDVNTKYVSPPENDLREFINEGFTDQEVRYRKVNPFWGRIVSGSILTFLYNGSDSYGRENKDQNPLVIYINYGHKRVCSTGSRRNINNGDQFFTGISMRYVDLEIVISLSRIISSKGTFLNYNVIKNIDKHIAHSAYRMYYTKNIPADSLFKVDIKELEY